VTLHGLLRGQQQRARAIVDARRVSCRDCAIGFDDWLQRSQGFEGCVGPRMLVLAYDDGRTFACRNRDRNNLFRQSAALDRGRSALLAAIGKRVLVLTRDMLSTPPAITREFSPVLIARAAAETASMLEPHNRFTVVPGTVCGRPASNSAMRATLRLSSPAWFAHPKITSST